jgi:DNA-binding transcriptional ArsR family regulator
MFGKCRPYSRRRLRLRPPPGPTTRRPTRSSCPSRTSCARSPTTCAPRSSQLSEELGIPKGTVGHHLKVLERAGLIHVVRTRQVRAVTEKFYGRTARLFLYQTEDPADERALGGAILRRAASEVEVAAHHAYFGLPRSRLTAKDARRLERRLRRLADDFIAAESLDGTPYALAVALYEHA